jgi:mannan endo-1,6-alpha-mannosidase
VAQNVFEDQAARWDDSTCGGGLRWQIFTFNNGYNYKNTFANGQFLALSARLARYTGNKTYSDWAEKAYTWSTTVGLVSTQGSVYDGADVTTNCSAPNHIQWSSTAGAYLYGSAVMYNIVSKSNVFALDLD